MIVKKENEKNGLFFDVHTLLPQTQKWNNCHCDQCQGTQYTAHLQLTFGPCLPGYPGSPGTPSLPCNEKAVLDFTVSSFVVQQPSIQNNFSTT